MSMDQVNNT
jgi:OCT family organic cation transporter-like MFS transporter 4/5